MSAMEFLKGMVCGAAVSGAAMLVFDPITPKQRKRAKKQVCNAMRSIADMTDGLVHMH